jgi:hypothetical protein
MEWCEGLSHNQIKSQTASHQYDTDQLKAPLRVACQQVSQTFRETYAHFIEFHFVLNRITDGANTQLQ